MVVDLIVELFYVIIKQNYNSLRKLIFFFFTRYKPNVLQINNRKSAKSQSLHYFFWNSKCCNCMVSVPCHLLLSISRGLKDLINSEKEQIHMLCITVQMKASCFFGLPVTSLSVHTSSSLLLLPGHWASQPGLSSSVPDWVFFCWETEVYSS